MLAVYSLFSVENFRNMAVELADWPGNVLMSVG